MSDSDTPKEHPEEKKKRLREERLLRNAKKFNKKVPKLGNKIRVIKMLHIQKAAPTIDFRQRTDRAQSNRITAPG